MNVVQVSAELGDGPHSSVGELPTLGKNKVAQLRACLHDLVNGLIGEFLTICEVKNTQCVKWSSLRWQLQERLVGDEWTTGKAQFTELTALGQKGCYRL
jgi:hypothetical protein